MLQLRGIGKSIDEQLSADLFSNNSVFQCCPNVRECSHSDSVKRSRCMLHQETH